MSWLFSTPKYRSSLWFQVIVSVLVALLFFFLPSNSTRMACLFGGTGGIILALAEFLPPHRHSAAALVRVIALVCFLLSMILTLFFLFLARLYPFAFGTNSPKVVFGSG